MPLYNQPSAAGVVPPAGDIGGTAGSPTVVATHLSAALPVNQGGTASTARNWAGLLTPTAVKTGAYNAAAGDFVPCDTTSAGFTVTLPTAPADLTVIAAKMVIQGGTNTVTIAAGGSDVFNAAGGTTTRTLTLAAQAILLQYKATGAIWYVMADDLPLSQLDSRYLAQSSLPLAIASGGTGTASTSQNFALAGPTSGSGAPAFRALVAGDLPAATTSTQGAVILDGTAGDIKALGVQAAGSSTQAAKGDHVHPTTGVALAGDPLQLGVTGSFTPWSSLTAGTVVSSNMAWYARCASGGYAISNIGIAVGASSGNCCVAAYQASGTGASAKPATQYQTSGSVATPSIGAAVVALGGSCTPQFADFLALAADNTTATFQATTGAGNYSIMGGFGYNQATAMPLPAPAGTLNSSTLRVFAMRGS